jgi:KaiC/GvpD/RAD55 family RecA-like ATPase
VAREARVGFGVPLLDELVPGGVPLGSLVVVSGPPGIGKSFLVDMVRSKHLSDGRPVFQVSLDDMPPSIEDELFVAINGFKTSVPGAPRNNWISIDPEHPDRALETIVSAVDGFRERAGVEGGLIIVDSLNTILVESEAFIALDFIRGVKALVRTRGMLGLSTLHTGIPGFEQLEAILSYMADGVVDLDFDPSMEELGIPLRRMRVRRMRGASHSMQWIPFTLTDKGPVAVDLSSLLQEARST